MIAGRLNSEYTTSARSLRMWRRSSSTLWASYLRESAPVSQRTSSKLRTGLLPAMPSLSAIGKALEDRGIGSPSGDGAGSSTMCGATGPAQLPSGATPIVTSWPASMKAADTFCARDQGPPMQESANIGTTRILMIVFPSLFLPYRPTRRRAYSAVALSAICPCSKRSLSPCSRRNDKNEI